MELLTNSLEWFSSSSAQATFDSPEAARRFARDTELRVLWEPGECEMLIFDLCPEDDMAAHGCVALKPVRVLPVNGNDEREQERLCRRGAEIWHFSSRFGGLVLAVMGIQCL